MSARREIWGGGAERGEREGEGEGEREREGGGVGEGEKQREMQYNHTSHIAVLYIMSNHNTGH